MTQPTDEPARTWSAPARPGDAPGPPDHPTAEPESGGTGTLPESGGRPFADRTRLPVVAGYEILGLLGEGGMAEVFLARHAVMRRTVALKVLRARGTAAGEPRFRVEAEALARLEHPGIVRVFDVGEADGLLYIAMEYAPGGRLSDKLKVGLPAFAEVAWLVESLARAVHAAHIAGIIHRDLKPQNVLLDAAGRPKVADFGLAKLRDSTATDLTRTVAVMGTPAYMAPEQASGRTRSAAETTDVYGLGAILYECLTGRPPFEGASADEVLWKVAETEPDPPRQVRPEVPRELEAICLRCLEKVPGWRYPTATALADDLAKVAAGATFRDRRVGRLRRQLGSWTNRPALAAALLAAIAAGASATAVYFATRPATPDPPPPGGPPVLPGGVEPVASLPVAPAPRAMDDFLRNVITGINQEPKLAGALGLIVTGTEGVTAEGQKRELPQIMGTAFVVTPDGVCLTCRRIVADAVNSEANLAQGKIALPKGVEKAQVRVWVFFEGKRYVAEVRYMDPRHDFAVLKVDRRGPYFRLRADSTLPRGEKVNVVGFPLTGEMTAQIGSQSRIEEQFLPSTFDYSMTTGIVSAITTRENASIVLHTAPMRSGAGGSPLVADDGTVVGVNAGLLTSVSGQPPQSFALALPQLREAIETHAPGVRWR